MNEIEKSIQQRLNYCVHYQRRGGSGRGEKCGAGMVYDEVCKRDELGLTGSMLRLPCVRGHHNPEERKGEPLCECPRLEWKTREQAEVEAQEIEDHIQKHLSTFPLIRKIKDEHRGYDWQGLDTCPVCANSIQLHHAAYNGHTRGVCATAGCVAWIE